MTVWILFNCWNTNDGFDFKGVFASVDAATATAERAMEPRRHMSLYWERGEGGPSPYRQTDWVHRARNGDWIVREVEVMGHPALERAGAV